MVWKIYWTTHACSLCTYYLEYDPSMQSQVTVAPSVMESLQNSSLITDLFEQLTKNPLRRRDSLSVYFLIKYFVSLLHTVYNSGEIYYWSFCNRPITYCEDRIVNRQKLTKNYFYLSIPNILLLRLHSRNGKLDDPVVSDQHLWYTLAALKRPKRDRYCLIERRVYGPVSVDIVGTLSYESLKIQPILYLTPVSLLQ